MANKEKVKEKVQEKESFEERMKKRKEIVKDAFLKLVQEHNSNKKFDYNKYICGTGGKGLICEAIGYNPNDRSLFQEILKEMKDDGKLYHIGGTMYTLK